MFWDFFEKFKRVAVFSLYIIFLVIVGFVGGIVFTSHLTRQALQENYKANYSLFDKACNSGDAIGCYELGLMYRDGKGVKQNSKKALTYLNKVCNEGVAESCRAVGDMFAFGDGVAKNYAKAIKLFKKACSLGDKFACGRTSLSTVKPHLYIPKHNKKPAVPFVHSGNAG